MPNHITNRLIIKAEGEQLVKILTFLKGKFSKNDSSNLIDFNNIVPMPESLNLLCGGLGDIGMEYIIAKSERYDFAGKHHSAKKSFEKLNEKQKEQAIELGKRYLLNVVYFGWKNWYDWRIEYWGTKWNAYDQELKNGKEIWFNTAWSNVLCLMTKVSEKFPDIEFEYTYADEDIGHNTGTGIIKNGVSQVISPKNKSIEAYNLSFEMRPEYKENYILTREGYEYKEEE